MKKDLSKYDVLESKMTKLGKLFYSMMLLYPISLNDKRKYDLVKKFCDRLICDAHIVFEIKNDLIKYIEKVTVRGVSLPYAHKLVKASNELEKMIFVKFIIRDYDLEKDALVRFLVACLNNKDIKMLECFEDKLSSHSKELLNFLDSKDYNFKDIPVKYKEFFLKEHEYFMEHNILPYVTKEESAEEEYLKGMKIVDKNVDANIEINLGSYYQKNNICR